MADWHAPSADHLLNYCRKVSDSLQYGSVATHCWGGTGRTGCFLAAYAIYARKAAGAHNALSYVRTRYNTHSVEMKAQYNSLARLCDHLGYGGSLDCEDQQVQTGGRYAGGGHWDHGHGDDGLQWDPGHRGTGLQGPELRTMISRGGVAASRPPYLTESHTAHVQTV